LDQSAFRRGKLPQPPGICGIAAKLNLGKKLFMPIFEPVMQKMIKNTKQTKKQFPMGEGV
jgi:hypothetical protein